MTICHLLRNCLRRVHLQKMFHMSVYNTLVYCVYMIATVYNVMYMYMYNACFVARIIVNNTFQ